MRFLHWLPRGQAVRLNLQWQGPRLISGKPSNLVYSLNSEGVVEAVEIFVGQFDGQDRKPQRKETSTMNQDKQEQGIGLQEIGLSLDDLVRRGARQVIHQAVEAELAQLLEHYQNVKVLHGQRAVVRNGYLPEREVLTGA